VNLSEHFTLEEMLVSETAWRKGINNTPSDAVVANLTRLAESLEQVRAIFGKPMIITSGYRCPLLNEAIGGAKNSAHTRGLAADFIIPAIGNSYNIAYRITKYPDVRFDQLIYEGTWVHFGLAEGGEEPRDQLLTATRGGYVEGLVA